MTKHEVKKRMFDATVEVKSFFDLKKVLPDIFDFECSKDTPDIAFDIRGIDFDFSSFLKPKILKIKTGDLEIYDSGVLFKTSQDFYMFISEDKISGVVNVICKYKPGLKRKVAVKIPLIYKLRSSECEGPDSAIARSFIYRCFYPVMQLYSISKRRTFVHGSTISKDNKSVIMTGWGGSGKTSLSSCALYDDDNYKFQSDDIAVVNESGEAFFNPMVAHIYPYNLVGFNEFKKRLQQLQTKGERFHWYIKEKLNGMKGVRRRVRPVDIYRVKKDNSKLQTLMFFQRKDIPKININKISVESAAILSLNIILTEVSSLTDILSKFGGTYLSAEELKFPVKFLNIDFNSYCTTQLDIYRKAFDDVDCYALEVPIAHGPKDLRKDTLHLL